MEQEIRFLDDEYQVACAVSGEGPPLVLPCWWVGTSSGSSTHPPSSPSWKI